MALSNKNARILWTMFVRRKPFDAGHVSVCQRPAQVYMDDSLTRKVLAYLRQHNVMTIAMTGTHGPWAAAVFYANRGFTHFVIHKSHPVMM
nr:hypothetical protein [Rhodoferax sp.]